MGTTEGFTPVAMEVPEDAMIKSTDLRKYVVVLTEYMGSSPQKQEVILSKYPWFEQLFDVFETKVCPVLRDRLERRNNLKRWTENELRL